MGEETPWGPDNARCLMMSWGQVVGWLEGDGRALGRWARARLGGRKLLSQLEQPQLEVSWGSAGMR